MRCTNKKWHNIGCNHRTKKKLNLRKLRFAYQCDGKLTIESSRKANCNQLLLRSTTSWAYVYFSMPLKWPKCCKLFLIVINQNFVSKITTTAGLVLLFSKPWSVILAKLNWWDTAQEEWISFGPLSASFLLCAHLIRVFSHLYLRNSFLQQFLMCYFRVTFVPRFQNESSCKTLFDKKTLFDTEVKGNSEMAEV